MWTEGEQCGGQSVSLTCPAPYFPNPSQACSGHVNGAAKLKVNAQAAVAALGRVTQLAPGGSALSDRVIASFVL